MRTLKALAFAALAVAISAPATARQTTDANRLGDAERVVKQSMEAPDRGIPKDLLEKAECVGVFPSVKKAAFVVGGEFGRGVFTCREKDGKMGAPAFFTLGGASVGWQWGGQSADLVLLVMNQNGVNHLLKDQFALGGEATAAAGPVGRTAQAATDVQLHAQILSWSRARGVFLGASIEGTVIKPDAKANERFYGKTVTAREILVDHTVPAPASSTSFLSAMDKAARR